MREEKDPKPAEDVAGDTGVTRERGHDWGTTQTVPELEDVEEVPSEDLPEKPSPETEGPVL